MYKLIINIIRDETGKNIEKNERFNKIFEKMYPLIFEENNSERNNRVK